MRSLRAALAARNPNAGEEAVARLMLERTPRIVGGYRGQGSEIDPGPLMRRLAESGAALAMPAAAAADAPLIYRAWSPGDLLAPDACGVPSPTPAAPLASPDLIIAPVLAFDRRGGRLGQGGGHFDRTLKMLREAGEVLVIGLAFAGQEVAEVPREAHDQALDAILTEK
ncbi:MAG TPA: 5-formyltetrahydrofolate cyclo-ligase, partial [Caulobacteraceae bacterium]